ncbi:PEP-CTERM sorting domain-containing protein [Microcystis sp. LE19-10.1B]|uniref:PEP-CTERM sorting domain-containing protein n=1 Tax=Microcystis sp. LE19-10.1B TaxID=3016428 RepID=UPI002585EED7|nr:PEP-CTERM sorting domain-containing protein [Microcystis sp. LE19-10.1B]
MMTTNKLTKILSGVATLGIATAIAAPAQAATFTVPIVAGGGMVDTVLVNTGSGYGLSIGGMVYDSVVVGDKVFSDFSVVAQVAAGDGLSFILNGGVWTVQYNPAGMGRNQGQLHYQVAITDPTMYFDDVLFDTDISGVGTYKASKEIKTLAGASLLTLESVNGAEAMGSIASDMVQSIKVIDTYGIDSTGTATLLQSSTNDFTQFGTKVPEPGTILGLLAVGGLGMVSRFKKQK